MSNLIHIPCISSLYDAFDLLCPTPMLFIAYYIFVFKHLVTFVKFDSHTMVTLEKLLGMKSFNTIVGHLGCHQVILFTFQRGLTFLQWFNLLPSPFRGVGL